MRIDLTTKPLLSLDEAKVVGVLSGVLVEGQRLVSLFYKEEEIIFGFCLEDVKLGDDAIILQNSSIMKRQCSNFYKLLSSESEVYNTDGKLLGMVNGIITDNQSNIEKIVLDNGEIDIFDVINIGDIILIDSKRS